MALEENISSLRPSNVKAFGFLILPSVIATVGLFLTYSESFTLYFLGQFILSFFFLQTFILLHECGHLNFFKTRVLNIVFGHIFGILTFIPFYSWQHMHNLHHRWTGWRDKDPTTEKTVEPSDSPIMRIIANVAWWLFIPLFYLSYKLSNYWNLFKIKRFLNKAKYKKTIINIVGYLLLYLFLIILFHDFMMFAILPAFIMSLLWKEIVIMTQHSHIEIPVSSGESVKPISYSEQVKYTRSFYLVPVVSKFLLFNFNLHEAHHKYPGLPAYWLNKVIINNNQRPTFLEWFKKAKSLKGEDYVFRTSKHTGKTF